MENSTHLSTPREQAEQHLLRRLDDTYRRRRTVFESAYFVGVLLLVVMAGVVLVKATLGDFAVHPYNQYSHSAQVVGQIIETI